MNDRMVFVAMCPCGCGGITGFDLDDRPDTAAIVQWIRDARPVHYVSGPVTLTGCLNVCCPIDQYESIPAVGGKENQ